MTSTPLPPFDVLGQVYRRLHHVLGMGPHVEDLAIAVSLRFLDHQEPAWLGSRPDELRLDVHTALGLVAALRN